MAIRINTVAITTTNYTQKKAPSSSLRLRKLLGVFDKKLYQYNDQFSTNI